MVTGTSMVFKLQAARAPAGPSSSAAPIIAAATIDRDPISSSLRFAAGAVTKRAISNLSATWGAVRGMVKIGPPGRRPGPLA
jgi:hypothetical protein